MTKEKYEAFDKVKPIRPEMPSAASVASIHNEKNCDTDEIVRIVKAAIDIDTLAKILKYEFGENAKFRDEVRNFMKKFDQQKIR